MAASSAAALLAMADLLTPNETEFAAMLARHGGELLPADAIAGLEPAQLHASCRRLAPAATVVVTLGAHGCFVSHPPGRLRGDREAFLALAAEPAQAIDTTGAGDAFNGALAASLALRDAPFATHAAFAGRYAARSTEQSGAALSMPRLPVLG